MKRDDLRVVVADNSERDARDAAWRSVGKTVVGWALTLVSTFVFVSGLFVLLTRVDFSVSYLVESPRPFIVGPILLVFSGSAVMFGMRLTGLIPPDCLARVRASFWRRAFAAHRGLTITSGAVSVVAASIAVLGNPQDRSLPVGCPGVSDVSRYVVAAPGVIHESDTDSPHPSIESIFTTRESEVFREIAFMGTGPLRKPAVSLGWKRNIVAYILGHPEDVAIAVDSLRTGAEISNLNLELTDDPLKANLAVCVGLTMTEHRENVQGWKEDPQFSGHVSYGLVLVQYAINGEFSGNRLSTSRLFSDGRPLAYEDKLRVTNVEVIHAFGLVNHFRVKQFGEEPQVRSSILGVGHPGIIEFSEFDRRMLFAIYPAIPTGSTWDEALERIQVTE